MSTVIDVEKIGKKYTISHQQRQGNSSLRDTLTHSLSRFAKALALPFSRHCLISAPLTLDHTFEDFWALKDVSFEVKQGERIGIIGSNGAGKSTLLKLLSRITEPTTGSIRIKGRVASLLEVGTGFHPELTGRENIYLNGAILGMGRQEITQKFDEIVAFSEVEKFLDTPVKRYSSGMYVRLAFAVAAHLDPEILIVDEVLAVGDAQFQKKCLGKMEDVSGSGRTVLFVSHNMQAIKTLCSRVVMLDKGTVVESGDASKVVDVYLANGVKQDVNTDLPPAMHRIKSEEIEIFRVEIVNSHGELSDSLLMGEYFSINFFWKIKNPEQSYKIGVIFRTADEIRVATIVNTSDGQPYLRGEKGMEYMQTVRLKNIMLPGKYHLDVNAKTASSRYVDAIDGICFTVLPISADSSVPQGVGIVWLDAKWSDPVPCSRLH